MGAEPGQADGSTRIEGPSEVSRRSAAATSKTSEIASEAE